LPILNCKGDAFLKRIRIVALFIIALCGLACQKAAQTNSSSNASNVASNTNAQQASQPNAPPQTHLKVGQPAPEFSLTDTNGQPVKLSDFRGKKNVVLAFYVLAFTGG
jgi:cytochrome oxidase Cu insertion factor (SCO1/SenC/PrrC family)